MKKTIFLFLLSLAVYGTVNVKAQVRIGGGSAAHPSSILDLNPSDTAKAKGGLLLPRVHLASRTDTDVFDVNPHKGLIVYNLNEDGNLLNPAEGIYCYNGEEWIPVNPLAPVYKGDPFQITVTPKLLWMGNHGELTERLDLTLSAQPYLGGCTMEYIWYLTDTVENKGFELTALTPHLQIVSKIDSIRKGRVYKLSCKIRVSQYETDRVDAGYVVYGVGAWLDNERWISIASANLGATIESLPAQLNHVPANSLDSTVYGTLYQWGRKQDGHESRLADITDIVKTGPDGVSVNEDDYGQLPDTSDVSGKFILRAEGAKDWRAYPAVLNNSITAPADTWTWSNPDNDPCKTELGTTWRVPTPNEWIQIYNNNRWVWNDNGILGYEIKPGGITKPTSFFLPAAGSRHSDDGTLSVSSGNYWSNTTYGDSSLCLFFDGDSHIVPANRSPRAYGFSMRCVTDGEGNQKPESEYMGGPFTVAVTHQHKWLGRDGELSIPPITFWPESPGYRVEYVWYFTDTVDNTSFELTALTPQLQIAGKIDRLIKGRVYQLSCAVRMGPDNNFETPKRDAGYVVYGVGAWIGNGKWINVSNANAGGDQDMTLSEQLASNHKSGYKRSVVGDYFQWGRAADGHERINSDTAKSIVPENSLNFTGTPTGNWFGKFILSDGDWREYPSNIDRNEWYWRTMENPETGIDPCNSGDNWFVMTLPQWDTIRKYNRIAWLDTESARGIAVYPNSSDDNIAFYLPAGGTRSYSNGKLFPSDNEWSSSWATGIWLNTAVDDSPWATGLIWSSGSEEPSLNTGQRSNPRASGLPVRCVSLE